MAGIKYQLPARVSVSHTLYQSMYSLVGLRSPYDSQNLLNSDTESTWNAGCFAPVTLTVDIGKIDLVVGLILVPDMYPKKGYVELIMQIDNSTHPIIHREIWIDRKPMTFSWTTPVKTQLIFIQFKQSPSWIALRCIQVAVDHTHL